MSLQTPALSENTSGVNLRIKAVPRGDQRTPPLQKHEVAVGAIDNTRWRTVDSKDATDGQGRIDTLASIDWVEYSYKVSYRKGRVTL